MSAIAITIATQVGKEAAKYLLKEYGDDALRVLQARFRKRASDGEIAPASADAFDQAVKETLVELRRPYSDFFGPRVGTTVPETEQPKPPPATFPYRTDLNFHPLQMDEASLLNAQDRIYKRRDGGRKWIVFAHDDSEQPDSSVWELDPTQAG